MFFFSVKLVAIQQKSLLSLYCSITCIYTFDIKNYRKNSFRIYSVWITFYIKKQFKKKKSWLVHDARNMDSILCQIG